MSAASSDRREETSDFQTQEREGAGKKKGRTVPLSPFHILKKRSAQSLACPLEQNKGEEKKRRTHWDRGKQEIRTSYPAQNVQTGGKRQEDQDLQNEAVQI